MKTNFARLSLICFAMACMSSWIAVALSADGSKKAGTSNSLAAEVTVQLLAPQPLKTKPLFEPTTSSQVTNQANQASGNGAANAGLGVGGLPRSFSFHDLPPMDSSKATHSRESSAPTVVELESDLLELTDSQGPMALVSDPSMAVLAVPTPMRGATGSAALSPQTVPLQPEQSARNTPDSNLSTRTNTSRSDNDSDLLTSESVDGNLLNDLPPTNNTPDIQRRPREPNNAMELRPEVVAMPPSILESQPKSTNHGSTPASPTMNADPMLAIPRTFQAPGAFPSQSSPMIPSPLPNGLDSSVGTSQVGSANKENASGDSSRTKSSPYVPKLPQFVVAPSDPPMVDCRALGSSRQEHWFAPEPMNPIPFSPWEEALVYRGKRPIPTQRPLIELWRPFYDTGIYPPAPLWFGATNPMKPHFLVYGDFRTGVGINKDVAGEANVWASRLNLDLDLQLTSTERIHGFIGPLDRAGDFTRLDFTNSADFVNRTDLRMDTLFFEGDAGAMLAGFNNQYSQFDLPFTFGFIPLIYQNGIWANDNVIGAAVALPAKHSRALNWSNFDATFFWASDQVTTDAFAGDNNAAEFFGTAWFIDAYDGYIEADYAFVHDDVGGRRSYNNFSMAFTRRYFMRVSNSIRYITNFGQSLPEDQRTADGHLVLLENSLISRHPNTVVPYMNLFYGQGNPQSLARAGGTGGILNNVGINFETDALTGYPTLDPTGRNTFGGALGVNLMGADFRQQLILETAMVSAVGSRNFRNAAGDQYGVGLRYQRALNNSILFRTDHMVGFMAGQEDIRGSRVEIRWKF